MKLWEVEDALSELSHFDPGKAKVELEQYPTSAHLAAHMAFHADLDGKTVLDLGCGTGMLSAASALLGAAVVVGVDIDRDALEIAADNLQECPCVDLILAEATTFSCRDKFDACLMNPPFGTRQKGIDVEFVKAGIRCARVVYSLHKSSTRDFLLSKDFGAASKVVAQLKFDIPKLYDFHTQISADVDVDLIRFDTTQPHLPYYPPPPQDRRRRKQKGR